MTNKMVLVLLLGLTAAAGYSVRDLWSETETAGVAGSESATPVLAGSPAPGGAAEASPDPEPETEVPENAAAQSAVVARLQGSAADLIDSDQDIDYYDDQSGEGPVSAERRPALDPDYEAFLEELEAREEAEDAAEQAEPEPEKPLRLTKEEIDALDEDELWSEAETYDADMAELDEELKLRLWEEGSYEFGPSEEELQAE